MRNTLLQGNRERIERIRRKYHFNIEKTIEDPILSYSLNIVLGPDRLIYIPSYFHNQIVCYDSDLNYIKSIGKENRAYERLQYPSEMVMLDNYFYVLERKSQKIRVISLAGEIVNEFSVLKGEIGLSEISRIFNWRAKLGILDRKEKRIIVLSSRFEPEMSFHCPDEPSDQIVFLKEVRGELLLPLKRGQVYKYVSEKNDWQLMAKPDFQIKQEGFISDVIYHNKFWYTIDCHLQMLVKYSSETILYKKKLPYLLPYKGIVSGEYIYLISSSRQKDGSGHLVKISIEK